MGRGKMGLRGAEAQRQIRLEQMGTKYECAKVRMDDVMLRLHFKCINPHKCREEFMHLPTHLLVYKSKDKPTLPMRF